jgi:hypothetical protein
VHFPRLYLFQRIERLSFGQTFKRIVPLSSNRQAGDPPMKKIIKALKLMMKNGAFALRTML